MTKRKEMLEPFCPTCGAYKGVGPCINPKCPDSIYYKIEHAEPGEKESQDVCKICGAPAEIKCSVCGRGFCKAHAKKYTSTKFEPPQLIGSCKICGKIVCSSCWVIHNGSIYCSNACIISESYGDNQIAEETKSLLSMAQTSIERTRSPLKLLIENIPSITYSGTLLNIPVKIMNYSSYPLSVLIKFTVRSSSDKILLFIERNLDLMAFDTEELVFPLKLPDTKTSTKINIEISAISNEGYKASVNKFIRCFAKKSD